jgi:hypothetical protein
MSQMGHLQTFGEPNRMSALPPKADIGTQSRNVRFGPIAEVGPTQVRQLFSIRYGLLVRTGLHGRGGGALVTLAALPFVDHLQTLQRLAGDEAGSDP